MAKAGGRGTLGHAVHVRQEEHGTPDLVNNLKELAAARPPGRSSPEADNWTAAVARAFKEIGLLLKQQHSACQAAPQSSTFQKTSDHSTRRGVTQQHTHIQSISQTQHVLSQSPFTELQLARLALSLSKLTSTFPEALTLCKSISDCILAHPNLARIPFSTWSSLLYGLLTAGHSVDLLIENAAKHVPAQLHSMMAWRQQAGSDAKHSTSDMEQRMAYRELNPAYVPHNLAQFLWVLAKAEYTGPGLQDLLDACSEMASFQGGITMQKATAYDWSQVLWAGARLCHCSSKAASSGGLRDLMEEAVAKQTVLIQQEHAGKQDISSSLWAVASSPLLRGRMELCHAAAQAIQKRALRSAGPQEWCNSMWALAKLGAVDDAEQILPAAVKYLFDGYKLFASQSWSNMLWGMATLGCADVEVVLLSLQELPGWIDKANAQEVANTLWALGKMTPAGPQALMKRHDYAQILANVAQAVKRKVTQGDMHGAVNQNWSNICWGMAALDMYEEQTFSTCLQHLTHTPLAPLDVSCTLYALAYCAHDPQDPNLLALVQHVGLHLLHQYDGKQLANILYSWAVLLSQTAAANDLAAAFFAEASGRNLHAYTDVGITMLAQAHLEATQVALPCGGLAPGRVREVAVKLWLERQNVLIHSSIWQHEIACKLQNLGYTVEEEASTASRMHRVDILITQLPGGRNQQIVVECDGPYHVLQYPPTKLTGSSVLRHRQLARHYPLVVIPWTYSRSGTGLVDYLETAIQKALHGGQPSRDVWGATQPIWGQNRDALGAVKAVQGQRPPGRISGIGSSTGSIVSIVDSPSQQAVATDNSTGSQGTATSVTVSDAGPSLRDAPCDAAGKGAKQTIACIDELSKRHSSEEDVSLRPMWTRRKW